MNTPNWAQDLILDAILFLQSKGYNSELPDIKWRKPMSRYSGNRCTNSSGVCYRTHITICAGKNRVDCKLVILHELAHWVLPQSDHHSNIFWDVAWMLYREYKLPIRYCFKREAAYKKLSIKAYHRSK